MKVILVEDEKLSAEHLSLLLHRLEPSIEVVGCFDTIKSTLAAFSGGLTADLLFLDIHLADGNSFEIFKQIQIDIPIIFTTAYDQYAIQAFKQNSVDYLLKPVSLQDVQFALEQYKKQRQTADKKLIADIASVYQQLQKQYKTRFLVKIGSSIDTIQTVDIQFFETKDSMSFLNTKNGHRYPIDYTLEQLESLLEPKDFFRINRKVILHIQAVEKTNTYFNGRLSITAKKLEGDARIVSRERVGDFKRWLDG